MSFFSWITKLFKGKPSQPAFQQGWHKDAFMDHIPGGKEIKPRFLVIHFTAGGSAKSSINFWREPKCRRNDIGAHFVIDRDGTVIQCRQCHLSISHAGASSWICPREKKRFSGLNQHSIGIELANGGDAFPTRFSELQPVLARHKNGGSTKAWESYPQQQLDACFKLSKELMEAYDLADVIGHDDIAPSRKSDPGPAFPMKRLRRHCGMEGGKP